MRVTPLLVCATLLVLGCSALHTGVNGSQTPAGDPTPNAAASSTQDQTLAIANCSSIIGDVPLVRVNSGKISLAAAFETTGTQLADYLEGQSVADGLGDATSTWSAVGDEDLDVCFFDGDLMTMTPGPPGHDTSAVRVLVVIYRGQASLWAIARKDPGALPTTDSSFTK